MSAPLVPYRRQPFETVQGPVVSRLARMVGELQTGLLEALGKPYALPFLLGNRVKVDALGAAGAFAVKHRLKRAPTGWLVLDAVRAAGATGDLTIYRRTGDTRDDSDLVLYASASFESLTLWVW